MRTSFEVIDARNRENRDLEFRAIGFALLRLTQILSLRTKLTGCPADDYFSLPCGEVVLTFPSRPISSEEEVWSPEVLGLTWKT